MPSHSARHSGRIIAEPAMAASTWSQRPCARAISAMGSSGSKAVVVVVPVVATTAQGRWPACDVGRDGRGQGVGAHRVALVGGDARTFARPKPARSAAFSTELWLCAEA